MKKAAGTAACKLIAPAYYATLTLLASIFGIPFWFFEQRRGKLADWFENERRS
jgi:hypothetical protein